MYVLIIQEQCDLGLYTVCSDLSVPIFSMSAAFARSMNVPRVQCNSTSESY